MSTFTPDFKGTSNIGDAIVIPMERLRRKGVGMAAAQAAWMGVQHVVEDNTTLNQIYRILPDVRHDYTVDDYRCGYFGVGVKGYKPGVGTEGQPTKTPYQSDPQDLQLYQAIPMSMRPYSNPLTVAEAQHLRLKTVVNKNSIDYIVYYARTLDRSAAQTKTYMRKTGEETAKEYEYTADNLAPLPKLPPPVGESTRVVASMTTLMAIKAHLSAFDVAELKNVCNILFGEVVDISEISFIQAAERSITDTDGTPYNRKELIDAQVGMSGTTSIPIAYTVSAIPSEYLLGAAEPLFASADE